MPSFGEQLQLMQQAATRNERRVDQLPPHDATQLHETVRATIAKLEALAQRLQERCGEL